MNIEYSDMHEFAKEELERLFLSVGWSSGRYPEKLVIAMRNYETVFSAWDGDKLVGLVSVMDDGALNAYIHYLLVDPDYQGYSIGKNLIEMVKEQYKDYLHVCVIAYNTAVKFYERCGFKVDDVASAMSIWS